MFSFITSFNEGYVRIGLLSLRLFSPRASNARTDVEHVDRSSALRWRSLSYIRGGIAAVGLNVSWDAIREVRGRVVEVEYTETPGGEIYNYS